MKKHLIIGNPIDHSLSLKSIIIGLKNIISMVFMKNSPQKKMN